MYICIYIGTFARERVKGTRERESEGKQNERRRRGAAGEVTFLAYYFCRSRAPDEIWPICRHYSATLLVYRGYTSVQFFLRSRLALIPTAMLALFAGRSRPCIFAILSRLWERKRIRHFWTGTWKEFRSDRGWRKTFGSIYDDARLVKVHN